jgi:hypothetical protein
MANFEKELNGYERPRVLHCLEFREQRSDSYAVKKFASWFTPSKAADGSNAQLFL